MAAGTPKGGLMNRILPWYLDGTHTSPVRLFFGWLTMVVMNTATIAAYVAGPLAAGLAVWNHFS
jgi:hypothetical protein